MNYKSPVTALALLTALYGCSEATFDHEVESQELMELSRTWSATVGSGDIEAALDFWATDAVMMPPDLPVLSGKDAIREYVTGATSIPGFKISWEPVSAQISTGGDMAYMIERNVVEVDGPDGGKIITHGKVVTVWRKGDDGEWKNVVDMWNTAPAPNGD